MRPQSAANSEPAGCPARCRRSSRSNQTCVFHARFLRVHLAGGSRSQGLWGEGHHPKPDSTRLKANSMPWRMGGVGHGPRGNLRLPGQKWGDPVW